MAGIQLHSGTSLPLDLANVDTDQIIPKQFLTSVSRKGYGRHLFHDWRYLDLEEKQPNPKFVLNQAQYQGATILLTRENFGCGSSREHAPWSLTDYGFRVVIASSFADIFYGNCINNQLLPVTLTTDEIEQLFKFVDADAGAEINVDLPRQQVSCLDLTFNFEIDPAHKDTLLKGLDEIGRTLELEDKINHFEQQRPDWQN